MTSHDISFEAIEAKVAEIENAFSFLRDPHIGTALDVITALRARLAEWEAKWRDEYVNAEVMRERLAEVEAALRKCRDYIISPLRMTKDEDEHRRRQDIIYDATAALASAVEAQDDE